MAVFMQASLEVFAAGPIAQQANNERLYRFWVQKCAHIANSVPASIGEMAGQIWRCAHGACALSCLSPDVSSLQTHPGHAPAQPPPSSSQHQQAVVESLKKHLLPRLLSCALPALSVMPEAVLHESLQDLCRSALPTCSSCNHACTDR